MNIWTVKEFSERWKVSEAFVYKCIKGEGLPLESESPDGCRKGAPAGKYDNLGVTV